MIHHCVSFLTTSVLLFMISLNLQAEVKPNLVLLPIDVSEQQASYESEYGSALQQGLQKRYTVFYGAMVEKQLKKEYEKIDCNAEACNQNVAIAFNGELIADSSVKQTSSGYLLKMVIRNVITGEVIETETQGCEACNEMKVIEMLKKIGAKTLNEATSNTLSAEHLMNQRGNQYTGTRPNIDSIDVSGNYIREGDMYINDEIANTKRYQSSDYDSVNKSSKYKINEDSGDSIWTNKWLWIVVGAVVVGGALASSGGSGGGESNATGSISGDISVPQ